ncbi:unnamed protein product [Hermetia illucens]|uniref:Chitin-binding type-2 domain-containing protein n=2 Tax=Hermetia illucens TaxID=343691 RepID=A0A7R8V0A1_HERIL|nr:unnamed protein product [Hermetia illucens]
MMLFTLRVNANGSTSTLPPCGQYGFRCFDSKTFQICAINEDPEDANQEVHECREGLICDEDNPAYCTPIDPMFTTHKIACPGRIARESQYVMYDEFDEGSKMNGRNNRDNDNNCGCVDEIVATTSTTTEIPTTGPYVQPEFDCEGYGFFPDFTNQTLFWFCDVPASGEGYYIRHMICGNERIFDPVHRACVLIGTTRSTRIGEERKRKKQVDPESLARPKKFSCCGKVPGRYADEDNCRLYHYCLSKEFAPVEQLTLLCPYGTAYDPTTNKCSCYATYRCLDRRRAERNQNALDEESLKDYPEEFQEVQAAERRQREGRNINCQTPMRFRDLNYCDGYFLCFGDEVIEMECPEFYKFDDNLLECLPEKIARCQ